MAALAILLCSNDTVADGVWNPGVTGGILGDGINNASGMGQVITGNCAGSLDLSLGCNVELLN